MATDRNTPTGSASIALTNQSGNAPGHVMTVTEFLGRLSHYVAPYRNQVGLLVLAMVVCICFEVFFPLSLKYLVDLAIIPRNTRMLVAILAGLAALGLMEAAAGFGRDMLFLKISANVLQDLRGAAFAHVQQLSMKFHAGRAGGDLLSRFTNDLASVEGAMTLAIPVAALAAGQLALSLVFLFLLQWQLAVMTTLGLIASVMATRVLEHRAGAANQQLKKTQAAMTTRLQENLNTQPVIKAFGLEQLALRTFRQLLGDVRNVTVRASTVANLLERIPNVVILLVGLLVVGVGAVFTFRGKMSVGDLIAFNGLFTPLVNAVSNLTSMLPQLMQAAAGMQRMDEILSEPLAVRNAPDAVSAPAFARRLEFQDVTFSYNGAQTNLERVSIAIEQGWRVAFVGASGAGKSTLLSLVLRFYDPDQGNVSLDGTDFRRFTQESLRAQMAVVFQESFLFNISIRENIRLGRPDASDAEVEEAARQAGVHDFLLTLPEGYDTQAGERGSRFSGGERQRISIARALLRNPKILLLDEATSALDPPTEAAINETLARLAGGRTVLSVTHRLAPIIDADRIIVLDRGRIAEQGRHAELLARRGLYARLWGKQSGFGQCPNGDWTVTPERLKAQPIFQELNENLLAELAPLFVTEQYTEGRQVIQEGQFGNRFYMVVRGKVAVERIGPSGNTESIETLEDGDHFGEIALLRNIRRTATVRTLSTCVFLSLQRDQFLGLLEKAPHLRERLEQIVIDRLGQVHIPERPTEDASQSSAVKSGGIS